MGLVLDLIFGSGEHGNTCSNNEEIKDMKVGDSVEKITGYKFPGVIVADYKTLAGHQRYVVECTIPGCEGMQHIYNPTQLRLSETGGDAGEKQMASQNH